MKQTDRFVSKNVSGRVTDPCKKEQKFIGFFINLFDEAIRFRERQYSMVRSFRDRNRGFFIRLMLNINNTAMMKNDIGINAGVIWNLLSENGRMDLWEIGQQTGYRDDVIHYALGWLARENKIHFLEENETIYVELNENFTETYY